MSVVLSSFTIVALNLWMVILHSLHLFAFTFAFALFTFISGSEIHVLINVTCFIIFINIRIHITNYRTYIYAGN